MNEMLSLSYSRANEIINSIKGKAIAVVGDVMLDRYFWGSVSRVSPEAPVPVIDLENETYHLGGAANVASNLKSLGAEPLLCGVVGYDRSGEQFTEICKENGINPEGLYFDDERPTTVKTRIIGNNQQIARLDRETRNQIPHSGELFIMSVLKSYKNLGGIIFEDYDKGTISSSLIREICFFAKSESIPVFVDPKFSNFFHYHEVTLFKPNRKEAEKALNMDIKSKEEVAKAGKTLIDKLKAKNVLITLGSEGMMLFEDSGDVSSVPTKARKVSDVSGAGDTAIATLSASYIAGANIKEAATLANYASGVVCEEPGIVSIKPDDLLDSIKNNG